MATWHQAKAGMIDLLPPKEGYTVVINAYLNGRCRAVVTGFDTVTRAEEYAANVRKHGDNTMILAPLP